MSEINLKLEVWKPVRPPKPLLYTEKAKGNPHLSELEESGLCEQVYSWKLKGDIWTSLGDDEDGKEIMDKVMTGFQFTLLPEDRGFRQMKAVLDSLQHYLSKRANRLWQDWQQLADEDNPDNTYRVQPLLSFLHHLKWLCEVYQDVPGISVTIR